MISCKQLRRHSARHRRTPPPSSLLRKFRTIFLAASTIATRRDPRQILPNEVVTDRTNESLTPREQNDRASIGVNHHVPTCFGRG